MFTNLAISFTAQKKTMNMVIGMMFLASTKAILASTPYYKAMPHD